MVWADDARGIDSSDGKAEGDGENGGTPAAAAEREEDDELRPGQARVLECHMPTVAEGETLYACLGDDVSKFTVFLESAATRGLSDEVGHRGAESASAAEGMAKRQVTAKTVELADEGVKQGLETLWKEGRLLSQESDPADVLRGREVRHGSSGRRGRVALRWKRRGRCQPRFPLRACELSGDIDTVVAADQIVFHVIEGNKRYRHVRVGVSRITDACVESPGNVKRAGILGGSPM